MGEQLRAANEIKVAHQARKSLFTGAKGKKSVR
jgi:hypothetical protein